VVDKLARFCDVKEKSCLRSFGDIEIERGPIEEGTCQSVHILEEGAIRTHTCHPREARDNHECDSQPTAL
jgi:hypothetical protein